MSIKVSPSSFFTADFPFSFELDLAPLLADFSLRFAATLIEPSPLLPVDEAREVDEDEVFDG